MTILTVDEVRDLLSTASPGSTLEVQVNDKVMPYVELRTEGDKVIVSARDSELK